MLIKILFSKGKKIMRRVGLCYVFTNSFNVRLNKIQLESHICFCILSDVMLHSLYGNIREKIILWFIVTISSFLLLELAVFIFQGYLNHCACHSQQTGAHKTTGSCWKSLRTQPGSPSLWFCFLLLDPLQTCREHVRMFGDQNSFGDCTNGHSSWFSL